MTALLFIAYTHNDRAAANRNKTGDFICTQPNFEGGITFEMCQCKTQIDKFDLIGFEHIHFRRLSVRLSSV